VPVSCKTLTGPTVHRWLSAKGIDVESTKFKGRCAEITGKRHLDDMTPSELSRVARRYLLSYEMDAKERAVVLRRYGLLREKSKTASIRDLLFFTGRNKVVPATNGPDRGTIGAWLEMKYGLTPTTRAQKEILAVLRARTASRRAARAATPSG